MNWVWLNIPLAAIIFAATVAIPLWLVFHDPGQRKARPAQAGHDGEAPLDLAA